MLVSATRLRLCSFYLLPLFAWYVWRSARQARRAPGFVGGQLAGEKGLAFWTLTAWEDEGAMRAYRASGPHLAAMPRLLDWCDEAAVVHWDREAETLPDWTEVRDRMARDGRLSKVRRPSNAHAAGEAVPKGASVRPGRRLSPKS